MRHLVFLVAWLVCSPCADARGPGPREGESKPAAQPSVHLVVSGRADRVAGSMGGGGGADVLIGQPDGSRVAFGGVHGFGLAGARWGFTRAGVWQRLSSRFSLLAQADLGRTGQPARQSAYVDVTLSVQRRVGRSASVEIKERYVESDGVYANILAAGGVVPLTSAARLRIELATTTSGTTADRWLVARCDLQRDQRGLFAGLAWGRTRLRAPLVVGLRGDTLLQLFVGVSFTRRASSLVLAFEDGRYADSGRQGLLASAKLPIRRVGRRPLAPQLSDHRGLALLGYRSAAGPAR